MYIKLISPKVYTVESDISDRISVKDRTYRTGQTSPSNNPVNPTNPTETNFILLENGFYMLTQDNFKIKQ